MRRALALFAGLAVACGPAPKGGDSGGAKPLDCLTSGHICTLAGTGLRGWSDDGLDALESNLFLPTDVALDGDGAPLIVDYNNMRVRRIEADGTLRTVVGTGIHAYAFDGGMATDTPIENPVSVAVATDGTRYVMEQHGARVLRVSADGWLDVFAGSPDNPGYESWTGDGKPAREATLSQSIGLALADDGTLYISDTRNHRIRFVNPVGIMGTLAGSGERGLVDGVGAEAAFWEPHHIAWAPGVLYVADAANHTVRRIDLTTSEVTTFAGTGVQGFSGDGGAATDAQLDTPQGVAIDTTGRVFVADSENHVVRAIEPDGTITTFAGQPSAFGWEGDGGPATDAHLQWPTNVTTTADGRVWICDTLNSVIRIVNP